ncbi:Serine/threonine-protein kinase PK-1 [Stieleria bergensis]|uniref:Serine/threonine-protein kinase PK-1 n=1 Tax=Stieleria bergensis TaxID=2528025 RepID=A0A517SQZ3_9BACT|nr:Serine/threonine-protein kinase PK-1 [Planctomycetes bacterium SV_7m_r]
MDGQRPSQLGIWRLGTRIASTDSYALHHAQPCDAAGSPRWDYVAKSAKSSAAAPGISQTIALGASLTHPNLTPILDGSCAGNTAFAVMPYIEGQTMQWHLERGGDQPLPVALWLVRQTCQALEAMHASGWIHRDIKPENILVGNNGHVTVIDYAFAYQGVLPQQANFQGTAQYAAPEILQNASAASPASDVFAAGRILWNWLTKIPAAEDSLLVPVCALVEQMVHENQHRRIDASGAVRALLKLEIDTLGQHIVPERRAA